jgi:serine/threonine-protein kinase
VQVYDYGRTDDGTFYYVMEFLPGLTLGEVVKRGGPLPPARVVHILRQVCGALWAAHLLGLGHRDVKPANVMLCRFADRADVAKLLDFGIVAGGAGEDETRLTQAGGILGTPDSMSPEQARGTKVGPASDLYSLGAVGFFLLTGGPPFNGTSSLELLHAHLTAPVPSLSSARPEVPVDLEVVILRLLAQDPPDRFASASDLGAALDICCCAQDWSEADANKWWESASAPDPSTSAAPGASSAGEPQ